jgi:hypothetical protein
MDPFDKDVFEEAMYYLQQYTYFWSSTIMVPEASRFDYRKLVSYIPDNVIVTIDERHRLVFEVQICQLTESFHPDQHYETVANALNKIQHALMEAYVGELK